MLVDDKLIVEVKSTEVLPPWAIPQLRNYLKATGIEVGLVLHFGPKPRFCRQVFSNAYKFADPSSVAGAI
jgi:GxxExxY protein